MANLFIISNKLKINYDSKRIFLTSKDKEAVIHLSKLENVFVLSGKNPFKKELVEILKARSIPVFVLNSLGHITKINLYRKRSKTLKNIDKIIFFILQVNYLQLMSYISRMKKDDRWLYRYLHADYYKKSINKVIKENDVQTAVGLFTEMQNHILYGSLKIDRRYETSGRDDVVVNEFHSLYISLITSLLEREKINPYQNISVMTFKIKYPDFSRLIFNLFKIGATVSAVDTLNNLMRKDEDFAENFLDGLSESGKILISKIFSESIYKIKRKFNQFLKEIIDLSEGRKELEPL